MGTGAGTDAGAGAGVGTSHRRLAAPSTGTVMAGTTVARAFVSVISRVLNW
jgi:hypothetical protein